MSEKNIFKGRLLKLSLKTQKMPNGYVARLEKVTHPGAVLIVPFISKDKVVMIRQYRPIIDSYIWELPAGTLGRGEKALACAKRELLEETGYSASAWKRTGRIFPAPGYTTEKIYIFAARGLAKKEVAPEADEVISCRIMTKSKVCSLMRLGRIVDAKTICALSICGII